MKTLRNHSHERERERERQREKERKRLCGKLKDSDPSFAKVCLEMFSKYNRKVIPVFKMENENLHASFVNLI